VTIKRPQVLIGEDEHGTFPVTIGGLDGVVTDENGEVIDTDDGDETSKTQH